MTDNEYEELLEKQYLEDFKQFIKENSITDEVTCTNCKHFYEEKINEICDYQCIEYSNFKGFIKKEGG